MALSRELTGAEVGKEAGHHHHRKGKCGGLWRQASGRREALAPGAGKESTQEGGPCGKTRRSERLAVREGAPTAAAWTPAWRKWHQGARKGRQPKDLCKEPGLLPKGRGAFEGRDH